MSNNGHKTCEFADHIVDYLYHEGGADERTRFEDHLASCDTCTDEFASVSVARFSVFEWRKEEFDKLATPSFEIPELRALAAAEAEKSLGWFAGIAALLSSVRSPMLVAATLLVCLGAGFVAITFLGTGDGDLVANGGAVPEVTGPVTNRNTSAQLPDASNPNGGDRAAGPTQTGQSTRPAKPETATPKSVPAVVKRGASEGVRRDKVTRAAQKPMLNDFEEDADDSLRLADLFDEIGR